MEAEEAKTGINHHPSLIVSGSVSPLPKLKETRKNPLSLSLTPPSHFLHFIAIILDPRSRQVIIATISI